MKMKVGDILKEEVKDMQGLHYPFKIITNNRFIYSQKQKIENSLLLCHCNAFINDLQNGQTSTTKKFQRSQSLSKTMYRSKSIQNSTTSKRLFRKYTISLEKNPLKANLPLIKDNCPLNKRKNISHNSEKKVNDFIFESKNININEKKILNSDKKIGDNNDKIFEENNDYNINNNLTNFVIHSSKRGVTPNIKIKKNLKSNVVNHFIVYKKSNATTKNKFNLRYNRKLKLMNQIIDKLNKPLFINNNIFFKSK